MGLAPAAIPAWIDGRLAAVDKLEVHRRGLRHKAVSVFVLDGRSVLLQQRAAGKYHTPLLWANACCTHPAMTEPPDACARRRLREELGITGLRLERVGQVEYRADVGGGLTEHEVVEVFRAEAPRDTPLAPDPAEVADTAWLDIAALLEAVRAEPAAFTPWLRIYVETHLERLFPDLAAAVGAAGAGMSSGEG